MNKILYTFIIPHRNSPDLLTRCINSIPQRDDIQIIVVDDNSDESKRPLSCSRSEVEYIYVSKDNSKGAGRARNLGITKAKGKWLLFPDADDFYNKDFLDVLDKYEKSSYDIVYFNFEFRDGKTLDLLPDLPFMKYFDLYDGTPQYQEMIKFRHNAPWTKMISKDYVAKYNLYFEEVPNGNDMLFSMMAGYLTNNIAVDKHKLYVYLKNENSISNKKREPIHSHMCRITHLIKQNQFYSYIGHNEWKFSIFKIIIAHILKYGLVLAYQLFMSIHRIVNSRNEWIEIIKSKQDYCK